MKPVVLNKPPSCAHMSDDDFRRMCDEVTGEAVEIAPMAEQAREPKDWLIPELPVLDPNQSSAWVQCIIPQTLCAPYLGRSYEFNRAVFNALVENFDKRDRPLPVVDGTDKREPYTMQLLAGWVHKLEVRDDGLWALIEFTDKGAAKVRTREVRYCGAVVSLDDMEMLELEVRAGP